MRARLLLSSLPRQERRAVCCTHALCVSRRGIGVQRGDATQPPNMYVDNTTVRELVEKQMQQAQQGESGINKAYGSRALTAMRRMVGPQGVVEALDSQALPIQGRATVQGTRYTMQRSTVFEHWSHECAAPVGWHMSKLGCAACKMALDVSEAAESLQLQIIKGCNVLELGNAETEAQQSVSRAVHDALQAFELDRAGYVMVMRCGLIVQPPFQQEMTQVEVSNAAPMRARIVPSFERLKASSLPSMQLKSGFRLSELTDEQLAHLQLRRVSPHSAAALTPEWLDAFFTGVAHNVKLECIDVLLLEGLHTLFDGRDEEAIDADVLRLFVYLEQQVERGYIQYYGIASPSLAPPIARQRPPLPDDAMVPDELRNPPPPPPTLNLYRLLHLAQRAREVVAPLSSHRQHACAAMVGNNDDDKAHADAATDKAAASSSNSNNATASSSSSSSHHLRFVQYPFNLTAHQAWSQPLPYDGNHTLVSLCRKLGLTTLGYSPLETTNLSNMCERYHNFPLEADLRATRMSFFALCERAVMKELEVRPNYEKAQANSALPPPEELFFASVFLTAQRRFYNAYYFRDWVEHAMMPRYRRALRRFTEAAPADLKEWAKQYDALIADMVRLRIRLLEHNHGKRAARVNMMIDYFSPTLARCAMLNQKAINFATHGCDTLLCGFRLSRYFHEATELNLARNGELPLPPQEMAALCSHTEAVSFANAGAPHPYMLEPVMAQGKLTKQRSRASQLEIEIDPNNPKFPDIPDEIEAHANTKDDADAAAAAATSEAATTTTASTGTTSSSSSTAA